MYPPTLLMTFHTFQKHKCPPPPIDTSKIKTEPREKLNVSCDVIVIDSDSNDSIVNLISETPSSTEKSIPPPNEQSVPETPPPL